MELFLSDIPLDKALKFFAALSAMTYNFRDGSFFEFQRGLVRELSPGNTYAARIIERLEPPNIFITLEQVAVLQKFSMMYCAPEGSPVPPDFTNRLLRVMLAYNSMRGLEDIDPKDREKAMLTTELRNMFTSHQLTGFLVDFYWRFFKWAQDAQAAKSKHYLDVNADFQTFYGMAFIEYAAAAFAFLGHYIRIRTVADLQTSSPFISVDNFLQHLTNQKPVRDWLTLCSLTAAEAKAELTKQSAVRYSGLSLQPLLDHPMIYVEPGVVYCPHIPFLENRIGTGLFFALLDGYNKADGNRRRSDRFTRFFGDFFESYCLNFAKTMHPTAELVFGEIEYEPGKKSTDIVVFEGQDAVFIDVTTARLTMKSTLIDLDETSILKDIDKIVDNARQMDGSIAAFKEGRLVFTYPDGTPILPSSINRIFPVALVIAPVPRFWAYNNRIFARLKDKGYLVGREPFEVLSAEDFDVLMRLVKSGMSIAQVLNRKFSHEIPIARTTSLWNYLSLYDEELRRRLETVAWPPLGKDWQDDLMACVRSWGLKV